MARTSEKLFAGLQSVLPQHGLSALVHWFMRRETKWLKNMQIRTVARIVGHRVLATVEKYLSQLRVGQRDAIDRYGELRFGT